MAKCVSVNLNNNSFVNILKELIRLCRGNIVGHPIKDLLRHRILKSAVFVQIVFTFATTLFRMVRRKPQSQSPQQSSFTPRSLHRMTQLMTLGAFMTVRYDPPHPQTQEVITVRLGVELTVSFAFQTNKIYFRKPSSFNVFDVKEKAMDYLFYVQYKY